MALVQVNTSGSPQATRLLETASYTNLVPGTSLVVSKAVPVPEWAETVCFLLSVTTMGGTTPLIDFKLQGTFDLDTTHVWDLGDWDGITQLTAAASPVMVAIDVGPNVTADDTGSATASSRYGVLASLPPWIVYKYTLDATTNDEDYAFTVRCKFGGRRN